MDNEKADELIAAVKELAAAITAKVSKPVAAKSTPTRDNPDSKEERVEDVVAMDPLPDWADVEMPMGKLKGKPLRKVHTSYVRWMAENWAPKGYRSDDALCAMIEAVCKAKEYDMPDYAANQSNDAGKTAQGQPARPAGHEPDEEIPF